MAEVEMNMNLISETCDNCKFYMALEDDAGQCRRYPPRATRASSVFPSVDYDDWCGEFELDTLSEQEEELVRHVMDGGSVSIDGIQTGGLVIEEVNPDEQCPGM